MFGSATWDGVEKGISFEILQNIQLAYGITTHKSQGPQFPYVIFTATKCRVLDRSLIYTAIIRARKKVVVLGDLEAVKGKIKLPPALITCLLVLGICLILAIIQKI